MANGLKEMVVELLSIKDGAFEEIRALWIESVDTTGVETVGELFEKFEKEKGRMLSAEDVKELLWNLSYVDIKEKVFADDAPWRPQNSSSRIGISTSLGSAPDGAPTTGGPGALMVTGQTAVTVSNLVTSSHDFARQQRIPGLSRTLHGRNCYLQEKLKRIPGLSRTLHGRNCYLQEKLKTSRKEKKALGAMLRTREESLETLRKEIEALEESLEREMKLSRTLHGQNRYLQEKLKVTLQEKEEILGQKNVEIRSPEQRMSVASRAGYHRTSFEYAVGTSGPANLGINSSAAPTPEDDLNLVVTERRAMKAPVTNQFTESQWQTSTRDVSEVQKLREENAFLITQLRSQEESSEKKEGWIEQLKSQINFQELKLKEKGEKIIQLERTCHEYEKGIQQAETEKESQRRAFDERLQQIESVTKEKDEKIIQLERTCHDYAYMIQKVQTEKESERQVFDEKLQQMGRAAIENCARHQQPERRSWIVQRHEVEVDRNEILGSGSWGTVFKGWFRGAPVAVKVLHRIIISDLNRTLFDREMELASRLRHKNLVQFMAATVEGGDTLIVTEFANGGNLAKILQQRTLPCAEVLSIASDIGQGILYLHSLRPYPILHRDIKSENVLVFEVGLPPARIAKVSDFGSANFMRRIMTPNQGTPLYSAPETQKQEYTTKADVYSFGLLVLEMSIRELPVPQELPRQLGKVVDEFLRQLIGECIQPSPDQRPDMQRVVAKLEQRKAEITAMNQGHPTCRLEGVRIS